MSESEAESRRKRLESLIPVIIKRAIERGMERATEAPEDLRQLVTDMRLPKEVAGYVLAQIDETKNGLFRVFAKEVRDFLEHTNLAGEMQKVLTTVQFEIHTTVRFAPNDGKSVKPTDTKDEAPDPRPEDDDETTRARKRRGRRGRSSDDA